LGLKPTHLKAVDYQQSKGLVLPKYTKKPQAKKELVGHDIFIHWNGTDANELAEKLQKIKSPNATLNMITNRGIKVWPEGLNKHFVQTIGVVVSNQVKEKL